MPRARTSAEPGDRRHPERGAIDPCASSEESLGNMTLSKLLVIMAAAPRSNSVSRPDPLPQTRGVPAGEPQSSAAKVLKRCRRELVDQE